MFVKGDNLQNSPIKHYRSLSFKALWQNPGYADWQKVYKGPYYGFGLSMGDFGNPSEIGYPVSLYGVLGIPIVRQKKLELFTEIQFGIANNWRYYNPITNPKNFAVGGAFTLHLDLGLKMFYSVSPKFDLGFGMSFIHFSNGGLKRPNHGLNIYSPLAELRYRFAPRPDYKNIQKPTKMEKSRDILFMRVGSVHQLAEFEPDSNYFAIFGYSIIVFDQISNAVRLGVGRDMNYWWGMTANTDGTMGARSIENLSVGYIFQPEMIIGKLTLVGGIGIYAKHLLYGDFKQTYQRLGVRFDIYKTFSLGVNVRAINFSQAEFMEFNLGYKLQWFR
ncbi:MAG: acyloxyacyl hydrolase [Bacteroidales bacterium]|nr:acyloxyacyl hydrolase [Bacteroidales bacterium]